MSQLFGRLMARFRVWYWLAFFGGWAGMTQANIPGGGDGTGPNVRLVNNGDGTVTISNGIVSAQINIATAQILQLGYNGFQVTDGGVAANNGAYWQGPSGSSDTLAIMADPSTNGGNFAMIQLFDSITNNASNADAHRYFAMFRGSPGIYAAQVMRHTSLMPAGNLGVPSLTCKLGSGIFNWLAQDTGRNKLMEGGSDTVLGGINNATKEVSLITSGPLAGQFDNKYDYSGDLGSLGFSGWCSTNQTTNFGLWMVHPSNEYFADGPMHREILAQMIIVQSTFTGVHFGFHPDMSVAAGENWSMVDGPFFLYFDKVPAGTTNPEAALYSDAQAQNAAERGAWPYTWFTDTNYALSALRGVVSGKIVINDSGNPNASASNLWVGVEQQPESTNSLPSADFQLWGKCYQFWTHTDANGDFTISNVIAGSNYTLFAFGPGAIGQFQSQPLNGAPPPITVNTPATPFAISVIGGLTNNLGNVAWTPARVGATVWEIGVPDRDTTEFRHGVDYWHGDMGNATNYAVNWAPWQDVGSDFPGGLDFVIGQSHWDKDWDYAEGCVLDPTTGSLNSQTWTITFNLPDAPANNSQASIYLGIAADYGGPIIVSVNGNNISGNGGNGFFPAYSGTLQADDAMIRMGSHGIFCDQRIDFPGSYLTQGSNTVTLEMRKGGYLSNSAMYDYIRLELTGYVPPPPGNLQAVGGNGTVSLWWPSVPGATAYAVSRSATPGGGYSDLATNIIGPTCGSVDDTASFTDTNAVNGTPYNYVVRSINPSGDSANSVQASATPSSGAPGMPAVPVHLSATAGNNNVVLKWNASFGAARYVIRRTVLTIGAVTTYSPGGINPYAIINSYVAGTNFTDTALANNVAYSYQVSAVNANGQSAFSSAANATPLPFLPTAPGGLSANTVSNQVTVSWMAVSNAANYIVSRGLSSGGPYTNVDNPDPLTFFADSGLNYNATYYYKVASANLGGVSPNSANIAVTTTPGPPASLVAVPGHSQVSLFWSGSSGAANYVLEQSTTDGGPYSGILVTTNTSFVNTNLVDGATYYYVVYGVGPHGSSPLSAQAVATPFAGGTGVYWINSITASPQDWNANTNWSNLSGFPNATQAVAIVNAGISANQTINLNQGITVGELDIGAAGAAGSFDIAGGSGFLTFDNRPGNALLEQYPGSKGNAVSAPIKIWGTLEVTNAGLYPLTLSGDILISTNSINLDGNIVLSGTNSFTGGFTLNSGAVALPATVQANSLAWGAGPIVFNGGTVQFNGYGGSSDSGGCTNSLVVPNGQSGSLMLPGRFGYSAPFSSPLTGGGDFGVAVSYIRDYFSGDWSAFDGVIEVTVGSGFSTGDFRINNDKGYAGAALILTNGVNLYTVYAAGQTVDIGELGGSSGAFIGNGSQAASNPTWRIGARNTTNTFAGVIADAGSSSLVKVGTGALELSGANTYSGGTIISNGILFVANLSGSGTGSGTVLVDSGGTLGGTGIVGGGTVVQSGGALSPGMNGIGTLTFSNALTLADGSSSVFKISHSPFTNDIARILGSLACGGTLVVTNISPSPLADGDSFQLFIAASHSGGFSNVILPALAPGLAWNTNALNSIGLVSVAALKSPTIGTIQISGADILISGSGGAPNWPYVVMMTTNLTSSWEPVATNDFNGSGNFIITLPNAADLGHNGAFYRLQLQ